MSDEENPANQNTIAQVLEGGVPQLLLGPAGKAISRLIGAAVEIPAAKFEQVAQGIKDQSEAKSTVMQAIANKTASLAVADPALLDRGLNSLLSKAYREQETAKPSQGKLSKSWKPIRPPFKAKALPMIG